MKDYFAPPENITAAALLTLLAPILWGTTYVTITELLPVDRPLFVAIARVLPAGLALVVVGWARSHWVPTGRQWRHLSVLAIFNFGLFFPLLIVAIYRLPGGVAASVGGIQPLLVGGITWIVGRKTMRRVDVVIGLIAVFGVAMVVIRPGAQVDSLGVVAAIGANVSFSLGVVATKTLPPFPHRVAATGWQLLLASCIIGPIAWVVEGPPPSLSHVNTLGLGYLSLVATGAAFILWFNGVSRLPTQAPPVLGLAAPLTGATLGWLLLGENLALTQILGIAIIVGAIVYAATAGAKSAQPTT